MVGRHQAAEVVQIPASEVERNMQEVTNPAEEGLAAVAELANMSHTEALKGTEKVAIGNQNEALVDRAKKIAHHAPGTYVVLMAEKYPKLIQFIHFDGRNIET